MIYISPDIYMGKICDMHVICDMRPQGEKRGNGDDLNRRRKTEGGKGNDVFF